MKGAVLVEVIIGVGLMLILSLALAVIWPETIRLSERNLRALQAEFLLEDGWEGLQFLRAGGWTSNIAGLNNNQNYRLTFDSGGWRATTSPTLIDGRFDRIFVLSPVYRDSAGHIANGGTLDPGSRQVVLSVGWAEKGATSTKMVVGYLTNLFEN